MAWPCRIRSGRAAGLPCGGEALEHSLCRIPKVEYSAPSCPPALPPRAAARLLAGRRRGARRPSGRRGLAARIEIGKARAALAAPQFPTRPLRSVSPPSPPLPSPPLPSPRFPNSVDRRSAQRARRLPGISAPLLGRAADLRVDSARRVRGRAARVRLHATVTLRPPGLPQCSAPLPAAAVHAFPFAACDGTRAFRPPESRSRLRWKASPFPPRHPFGPF